MALKDIPTKRDLDDYLAINVMGWTEKHGDWYMVFPAGEQFRALRLWKPTGDAEACEQLWIRCLLKARDLQYEICIEYDDEARVRINAHHPQLKRLVVIDPVYRMGVCRFALAIHGLEGPPGLPLKPLNT